MKREKLIKNVEKNLFRNGKKPTEEWESIKNMIDMFNYEMEREWSDDEKILHLSDGNEKCDVTSYSTMPGVTCMVNGKYPKCFADGNCYALYDMRNIVPRERAVHNTVLILKYPEYFRKSLHMIFIKYNKVRIHVDGDFANLNELKIINEERLKTPNVNIIIYTKKYDMCNKYMDENGIITGNLTLMYSEWDGIEMRNPHNMPTCKIYKTMSEYIGSTDIQKCGRYEIMPNDKVVFIKGQCENCFFNYIEGSPRSGCWGLKQGQTVAMLAH